MQGRGSYPLRAAAFSFCLWLMPGTVVADESPSARPPSCHAECSALGVDKVKAGDEHCGLVARKRKHAALDAACKLAESHREEQQALARERAENKCGRVGEREGCRCEGELRRWENVYTNHFSQRCWAECGWAYFLECEREPETAAGSDGD